MVWLKLAVVWAEGVQPQAVVLLQSSEQQGQLQPAVLEAALEAALVEVALEPEFAGLVWEVLQRLYGRLQPASAELVALLS